MRWPCVSDASLSLPYLMPLAILLSQDDDIIQMMETPYHTPYIRMAIPPRLTAALFNQDELPTEVNIRIARFDVSDGVECLAYQLLYNRPDVYVYRQVFDE